MALTLHCVHRAAGVISVDYCDWANGSLTHTGFLFGLHHLRSTAFLGLGLLAAFELQKKQLSMFVLLIPSDLYRENSVFENVFVK